MKNKLLAIFCIFLFPYLVFSANLGEEFIGALDVQSSSMADSTFNNKVIQVEKKVVDPQQLNLADIFSNQLLEDTQSQEELEVADFTEDPLLEVGETLPQDTIDDVLAAEMPLPLDTLPQKIPFEPVFLDTLDYARNPLFNELVYMGKEFDLDWRKNDTYSLFYEEKPRTLNEPFDPVEIPHPAETLEELRRDARNYITSTSPQLYKTTVNKLPKLDWSEFQTAKAKPIKEIVLEENNLVPVVNSDRIVVRKKKYSPWTTRLDALLQFSQTAISANWYKGGNDFFSLLGALSGKADYDNRKKIKWENNFEWRTGFNTVTGDTLRKSMPSDDIFKLNSKYGIKATGGFYYSSSFEFQTQFYDNPKGVNQYELKARFLTPIRLNVGLGMDYKYKNLSVALSPLSFKYIYLAKTDLTEDGFYINPNTFGIEEGENQLKEFGSKLIVELKDYRPISELKLNSKFYFYTNYEKVEIDWEIVAELTINRFFSTRLMLNPRFDNTVILPDHQKAKIQMKEMLTVGFSYRIY